MKAETWQTRITKACEMAGTYRSYFDEPIKTLAGILEKRDEAEKQFKITGGQPVVAHTNKNGSTNIVKNPVMAVWCDLNALALSYWRDLGLTPAGLKKLDDNALKQKKGNALAEALRELA